MFQISTICVHWVTLMPPLEQTFYFLASVMEHGNSRLQVDPELLNIGGHLILNVLPKCCLSCTSSYTAHWHCSIQINTIEMQASRKEMMQQRGPRTHQESVNEAFDDAAVWPLFVSTYVHRCIVYELHHGCLLLTQPVLWENVCVRVCIMNVFSDKLLHSRHL